MRSIGKKYKRLVKKTTLEEIKKGYDNLETRVINKLPVELWDTWEMADQEIRRIIEDVKISNDPGCYIR